MGNPPAHRYRDRFCIDDVVVHVTPDGRAGTDVHGSYHTLIDGIVVDQEFGTAAPVPVSSSWWTSK